MFKTMSWKQLVLPFLLVIAVLINKSMIQPPAPKGTDTPLTEFSAERAMEHVRKIATQPHAVGSAANARVREMLVAHLKDAGLETEVQSSQIVNYYSVRGTQEIDGQLTQSHAAASIKNVVARLKGKQSESSGQTGKALVLMSHYDSVYYGPGAGDDASGTATLLETLRALQAAAPLKNDVIFLFTDAEEMGLFGAQAFFKNHRWAKEAGLVLDFEARGSKGPVNMFQTGKLNNKQIQLFADAVETPLANSLMVTAYEAMPNDTDMSISLKAGIPGMNFAFTDGFYDYHTAGDNPDNLSPATLQHMGDQALAMTRVMGNQILPLEDTSPAVFFDFLMLFMISYPLWGSWLVAAFAVVAMAYFVKGKLTSRQIGVSGILKGALAALMFLIGYALIIDLLFLMIGGRNGDMVEGRRLFALANTQLLAFSLIGLGFALAWFRMTVRGFNRLWLIAGVLLSILLFIFETSYIPGLVGLGLTGLAYIALRNPIGDTERLIAGLDLYLLIALIIQFLAPAGSHLFMWPFLVLVGGLILHQRGKAGLVIISVTAMLGALWLGYFTEMGYSTLGIMLPSIIAVPFGLLLLMLVPTYLHVMRDSHQMMAYISAAFGLVLIAYAGTATGFSERYKQPSEAFYILDAVGDGTNYFGSRMTAQDSWSSQLITEDSQDISVSNFLAGQRGTAWITPAPMSSSAQKISLENIISDGDHISVTLTPGYRGDIVLLTLKSAAPIRKITLNGAPLHQEGADPVFLRLTYFAVPKSGLTIDIISEGTLTLQASEISSAWPQDIAAQIPPKPANIMAAPYRLSDMTISSVTHVFRQGK